MTEYVREIMQKQIDELMTENLKLMQKISQLHDINDDLYEKYMKVSGLLRLYENMERKKRMERI